MWTIQFDERLEKWFDSIPFDIKAKILRITDMLVSFGPSNVKEPYVKPVKGYKKLFEIRAKGKKRVVRVFYFTYTGQRIILLHGFMKKTMKTPQKEINIAVKRMREVLDG